jgi:acyl-coenzyme A thioesterase PaaI-like protein
MKQLPEHGVCFVCGKANPHSIGVTWFLDEGGEIFANAILSEAQQGPPGFAHGGASAAVLDEAMGAAVWQAGYSVAAVNLTIDYRHPVPLGQAVTVHARITERDEHKIFASGEITLSDGTVAVSGRGIYVEAPQLFGSVRFSSG